MSKCLGWCSGQVVEIKARGIVAGKNRLDRLFLYFTNKWLTIFVHSIYILQNNKTKLIFKILAYRFEKKNHIRYFWNPALDFYL